MKTQENFALKRVCIVMPTYNEKENISKMLNKLIDVFASIKDFNMLVLVVDDNSPDGTGVIVEKYTNSYQNIHLLRGKKEGLGKAYTRGFIYAIENLKADFIFEMDADFSHDPEDIPKLLESTKDGSDFVIGSRYIRGGFVPSDWGIIRLLNSKIANLFARFVAGLYPIHDCTAGFRCISTEIIKKIDLERIGAVGYSFQMNLLFECVSLGAKVKEVPNNFIDREFGKSKIRLSDRTEFIINAFKLRMRSVSRLIWSKDTSTVLISLLTVVISIRYLLQGQFVLHVLVLMSLFLTAQGLYALSLMLYTWEDPERLANDKSPTTYHSPHFSFTALVPVRHEEGVIEDTLRAISSLAYPTNLTETIVICSTDDVDTIRAVKTAISKLDTGNIFLTIYSNLPINKPHALNEALKTAKNDVVVIFDAEDEPHKDIYNIVNTVMLRDNADVVQSGVQLMNYHSHWFSMFNVMEYYFWFKSSLHFYARAGVIPLGGNTAFFKKEKLLQIGGWDQNCLTEDADIGLRLSKAGANIRVVYDEQHTTREETPPTVAGLVKQRTRWNQGFLQIFLKGDWLSLPYLYQRFLALYIFLWPVINAFLFLYVPFSIWWAFSTKMPVLYAIILNAPLYILVLHLATFIIGLYEFTRDYKLKYPFWIPFKAVIFYYPYQLLLGYSALRAVGRLLKGDLTWEKTQHINAHRQGVMEGDMLTLHGQPVFLQNIHE